MILIKGHSVRFEMRDGGFVNLPPDYGMVHDPGSGRLPYCNLYFGPYDRTNEKVPLTKPGRAYFGRSYESVRAVVDVPTDDDWIELGEIEQVFYTRIGKKSAGGETKYFHRTKKNPKQPTTMLFKHRTKPWHLLGLADHCEIDDRGIAKP